MKKSKRIDYKNIKLKTWSIKKDLDTLYQQDMIGVSKHKVYKKYLVKGIKELNIGFLSNIENMNLLVGEKSSVLFLNERDEYCSPDISLVIKYPNLFRIILPIPYRLFERDKYGCNTQFILNKIDSNGVEGETKYTYILNRRSGYYMGTLINNNISSMEPNEFVEIIKHNPNILFSTNKDYIYGLLFSLETNTDNKDFTFIIEIKKICCLYLGLEFALNEDEDDIIYNEKQLHDIFKQTISKDYSLVSCCDIKFEEVNNNSLNNEMYDFTSEDEKNTNFTFPFLPILKNSDGDVLTIMEVSSKQGLEDCKKFSPEQKEYFRSLNDGEIKNYIADDAVLGLYKATKIN